MEQLISVKAIDSALRAKAVFCKFLSANDSGETGGHQSGILISKSAKNMLFSDYELEENHILKKLVRIRWQDELFTDSCFTWYESKNELRVTKFGRGFPLIRPEKTGALFVLSKLTNDEYEAFVLNTEEEIQQFLDAFGLSPADTNRPVEISRVVPEIREKSIMDQYLASLVADFPTSSEMARAARWIQSEVNHNEGQIKTDPDKIVLSWTNQEYRLFRAIEQSKYGEEILRGFTSVEDFIVLANQVLNRRKSRAGKSLEHHLSAIFDGNNLRYSAQGVTEGNKKPDFIFPSVEDYHNPLFAIGKLCTLAAKTTCKDRWRQVLNEADRLKDQNKYLCTLQQGISSAQMDEMQAERVVLVVPKEYISSYPAEKRDRIWTIKKFVHYVHEMEGL